MVIIKCNALLRGETLKELYEDFTAMADRGRRTSAAYTT